MPGSDLFEQELRERIQAYIMRPSGELWEKIEASLPIKERRKIFLKKYVLLLPFLMLSISLSKNNHIADSISVSKKQEAFFKHIAQTKADLRINPITNNISGYHFLNQRADNISSLLPKSNPNYQYTLFAFQNGISTYDQSLLSSMKVPFKWIGTSINLNPISTHQKNNNSVTSEQIEKEQASLSKSKLKKGKAFLVYFSAAISDRSFNPKNKFSFANYGFNENGNQIAHAPALGWEAGLAFLKQIKPGLHLRSGIQFNYSRYTITASQGAPEFASLSLNNMSVSQRISNLENRNGFKNQKYPNSSYQISVPVGLMIRLNKNHKSNLNIGISVQPSYTVHASAFLLSSDYRNYVEAPDMLRRFNIYSGAELVYSKKIGQYRLLAGPQLRYQLLSRHKKEYSFRENLIDYGFKLGIARDLP
jgi:hypothetical protein